MLLSIKDVFIIGHGPSSSHTMAPAFACDYILKRYKNIQSVEVILYGSLALTGKGHLTDYIIKQKFKNIPLTIIFDKKCLKSHPNTMEFNVLCDNKKFKEIVVSVGGGRLLINNKQYEDTKRYPFFSFQEIIEYCLKKQISLIDFILEYEDKDIFCFIENIYKKMNDSIKEGLNIDGFLPGRLKVKRKAKDLYNIYLKDGRKDYHYLVMANAFAASENNASGGEVVIAPTCGSCGVVSACISYLEYLNINHNKILNGLLVAGLIGSIAKTNASISGAECGCQAEIGVASAMASALITYALGGDIKKIGQSAEIALEHSLGLTCDPIGGYVQIPCIERNAIFALKSIDSALLALAVPDESNKISFDECLKTMYETGKDLRKGYKETSKSGLSKLKNIKC